ncbi:hypothetical protein KY345_02295 [Candidatus Woesearchaeota archaeon]|nr:hypothetical protein [Candidatus Woesearchaeota archaeon]
MDKNYIKQLRNGNLKRVLLREENIPILEELLDRESQRFIPIQRKKKEGKLDFGGKVAELDEFFSKIKEEVDSFLGISDVDTPRYGYFNLFKPGILSTTMLINYAVQTYNFMVNVARASQEPDLERSLMWLVGGCSGLVSVGLLHSIANNPIYNPLSKTISLKREKRALLTPNVGHEYTHYVQDKKGLGDILKTHSIFNEGQARGVQRHISEAYMEREDNKAFLYDFLDTTVGEMKSAYLWMCRKLKKPIRKTLLKVGTSRDGDEGLSRVVRPTAHAIGNCLFSIHEAKYGSRIYGDVMNGRFQFA